MSVSQSRWPPLSWHLALLAACAVIPVLIFSILLVVRLSAQERTQVERGMVDVTHVLAAALDREILVSVGVLELLAQSSNLSTDNLAAFQVEAQRVVARRPGWQSILLINRDGQQMVNTLRPWGTPLARVNEPESFLEVLRTGKPAVGNLARGVVTGELAIPVRVPVVRDGVPVYVLTAAVRPESFQDLLVRTAPPRAGEWTKTFTDRNGVIVARSRQPERFVGQPATTAFIERSKTAPEDLYRDTTIDGAGVYVAFTRAPFSQWQAGIAFPVAAVDGPLRRSLALTVATGLALIAVTAAAAYVGGRRIAEPIRAATNAAQALTRGERVPIAPSPVREVAELGEALERSADLLRERDAERAELLQQAQAARGDAEAANRAKDDFLATLSHELRSPLAAMVGWVRMLRMGQLTPAQTTHALEVIERNLAVQTNVIADLLDVSRIVAGKLRLERHPTDVRVAVEDALEQVRQLAEDKRIVLTTTRPSDPALVDGDPARLVQIVGNLVSNAVKFTPPEGRVTIEVGSTDADVTVAVADTGIGIPADILPHVFERFLQAEAGGGVRGLGLGLAIVRTLTELHGGRVDVSSEGPDRGARFVVTLPRSAQALETSPRSPAAGTRRMPPPGLRVLVVEDQPDSLEMLTTLLAAHGLAATGVASVDEALAAWERHPFDALVSDLRMPGRDGYALVAEIRRRENGVVHVRAVAVSANAAAQDMERAIVAGFDTHLAKPVDPEDLLAALA